MPDPQPVINPYRVLQFVVTVLTGIVTFSIVPPDVAPWLSAGAWVGSMALLTFFNGSTTGTKFGDAARSVVASVKGHG